ncbi:[protein-PII] uridylyltransferase [Methylomarinum sp. Ch1-1]|uniref:Bifunctional uridylyltransferase/uridylyl-removing enzyme n=1 Tax=Methylomarinum roseum TaxID=3067653 RepID=A0AAU7NPN2_9GAMM
MNTESDAIASFTQYFAQTNAIALFKEAIIDKNAQLTNKFDPQHDVLDLLREKSLFIDHVLSACWRHFLDTHASSHSLIATGGYGRNELFPHSDIDIVILLNDQQDNDFKEKLPKFCNFLWDIGLNPGQSVRTIEECIDKACEDQTIITSLMEMRLITGNEELAQRLKTQISSDRLWPSASFFQAKMAEQTQRYNKFHDTAYNLEPNIKEGPGGLRDLQIIAWVFKRHYDSPTLRELIKYDFMPASEYDELILARNILWRLRFALHALTNRCENRLLFDYQRDLAKQFGYLDQKQQPDVEAFMQFYFKTVANIEQLNEILLQLFNERFIKAAKNSKPSPITANFSVINGYLEVSHKDVFNDNPLTLLEIFLLLQQSPSIKGIRATTIRLIRKSLHLIDDDFRRNKKANRLFIEILRQPRGITHQLRRMNRYGILAAYLPSFANIVQRMQYDLFHIYTVDEHTLFVIRNLRRFALDKHNNELPFCNNIFLLIPSPDILYIAALFHDIAKGKGGDHSQLGEKIANDFCLQHDLPSRDRKLITWLVRHHLLMSTTAQKKDISDPTIIHEFAQQVGSIKYLNYLYLLTVADIRATNPSLWNSWKDSLLKELYISTHNALHRGLDKPIARSERLEDNKKEAADELLRLGISPATIKQSWQHFNDDYFLRYSGDEIAWHTIAIAASKPEDLPLVLLRPHTQRGSAEIFVYTQNKDKLFSICTATLDRLGMNIMDARIITTADQYVLNSFQILEQSGEAINDLHREIHICTSLRNNLISRKLKRQKNVHRQSRQARHFPIKTRISYLEDPMHKHTAMELITTDRAGLLSIIGQAFRQKNIQLHDARITTIGSRAEDMFYITDRHSQPIKDADTLAELKNLILELLDG